MIFESKKKIKTANEACNIKKQVFALPRKN